MSAPAAADPTSPASAVPPLNLPVGSVRALITLAVLGTVWAQLARSLPVNDVLQSTLLLVLGYFFGTHAGGTMAPADGFAKKLGGEDDPHSPLFLPSGSIRLLIVVGFGAVALKLYQDGKVHSQEDLPPVFTLVASFLGGGVSKIGFRRMATMIAQSFLNKIGHAIALTTLGVVVVYCAAIGLGHEAELPAKFPTGFMAIVGFYLGRR